MLSLCLICVTLLSFSKSLPERRIYRSSNKLDNLDFFQRLSNLFICAHSPPVLGLSNWWFYQTTFRGQKSSKGWVIRSSNKLDNLDFFQRLSNLFICAHSPPVLGLSNWWFYQTTFRGQKSSKGWVIRSSNKLDNLDFFQRLSNLFICAHSPPVLGLSNWWFYQTTFRGQKSSKGWVIRSSNKLDNLDFFQRLSNLFICAHSPPVLGLSNWWFYQTTFRGQKSSKGWVIRSSNKLDNLDFFQRLSNLFICAHSPPVLGLSNWWFYQTTFRGQKSSKGWVIRSSNKLDNLDFFQRLSNLFICAHSPPVLGLSNWWFYQTTFRGQKSSKGWVIRSSNKLDNLDFFQRLSNLFICAHSPPVLGLSNWWFYQTTFRGQKSSKGWVIRSSNKLDNLDFFQRLSNLFICAHSPPVLGLSNWWFYQTTFRGQKSSKGWVIRSSNKLDNLDFFQRLSNLFICAHSPPVLGLSNWWFYQTTFRGQKSSKGWVIRSSNKLDNLDFFQRLSNLFICAHSPPVLGLSNWWFYQTTFRGQKSSKGWVNTYTCSRKKEFQIIIQCENYFDRWSFVFVFSSNEDDLNHSSRMTFPGSIRGRANAPSVYSSHIFRAGQTSLPHSF